jgi:hypothetical protein
MLSAVVQTQSAIIAIVITLTLIAVQLTASAYSPRVVDIFKKNPDMWILLSCYGVSIFYGFIVLKLVKETEGGAVSQSVIWSLGPISISFEFFVSLAYWLGAFTFVALFPYMWYIISLLKSENIINRLANEITKDKILEYIKLAKTSGGVEKRLVADPIQPIVDIIHGSIMKYDLETTRVGLKAVTDQVIKILVIKSIGQDDEREILKRFCNYLRRISKLAISREDIASTAEVIENFEIFGRSTAKNGLETATLQVTESLEAVGCIAAENGLEAAQVTGSLEAVGRTAAENGLEAATLQAAKSLEAVGRTAAENGLGTGARVAVMSLGKIRETAAEKGLEKVTGQVAWSLGVVGRASAENGFETAAMEAVLHLGVVGMAAVREKLYLFSWDNIPGKDDEKLRKFLVEDIGIDWAEDAKIDKSNDGTTIHIFTGEHSAEIKMDDNKEKAILKISDGKTHSLEVKTDNNKLNIYKGLKEATRRAVWSLGEVGRASVKKGFEVEKSLAARYLGEAGRDSVKKGFLSPSLKAAEYLGIIGKFAAYSGLEAEASLAVRYLEVIGKIAAEKGPEHTTRQAVEALGEVGRAAVKNELEDVIQQAADSLAELTLLSEEIVKTAIHDYELKLEMEIIQDRGFMPYPTENGHFKKIMKLYEQKLEELRAEK